MSLLLGAIALLALPQDAARADGAISVTFDANRTDPGSYAYEPNSVKIAPGESVTWENVDNLADQTDNNPADHPTFCNKGKSKGTCPWSQEDLPPGGTFTMEFPVSGTFEYFCSIHPYMIGKVVVGSGVPPAPEPEPTNDPAPEPTSEPAPGTTKPATQPTDPSSSGSTEAPTDEGPDTATTQSPEDADNQEPLPNPGSVDPAAQSGVAPSADADDSSGGAAPAEDSSDDAEDDDGGSSPALLIVASLLLVGAGGATATQMRKSK